MVIPVPSSLQEATIRLFTSSEKDRRAVLDVFQSTLPTISSKVYEKRLAEFFAYKESLLRDYVRLIFSIYNLNEREESSEKIAEGILQGILELDSDAVLEVSEEGVDSYRQFLLDVLGSHDSLGLSAKGLQVILQHGKTFGFAEIYTDIRSIFSKDSPEDSPGAATITHTLKLHTHGNSGYEDLYVAMDYDDLMVLKKVIERAEKKHTSSKGVIEKASLAYLPTEGEANE